jgi:G3E family GTPase
MQIALAQLLRRAKPHRLLVEPTGLGHPLEVLRTLSSEHYREVLSLQKTLTMVDARNLADQRYTSHPTFMQQLEIADIVVANKQDLYNQEDRANLDAFVHRYCKADAEIRMTQHGQLPIACLTGLTAVAFEERKAQQTLSSRTIASDIAMPESGVVTAANRGEGYESIGWRFDPAKVFNRERLHAFFGDLDAERMKAVLITGVGIFGYNMTRDALTEIEIDECMESRIEIIADQLDPAWESRLTACLETAWA